eukprot:GFUD01021482.1.p1 GENE.GFUD01021482.1~~GFUD01021482.1.p1  ORF type:complete len:355 (+),score=130.60 GFUD01021482.1:80-1144(+)
MSCLSPAPAMPCLEAMYKDITKLLGDISTTDMVVRCGELGEIRVHSVVLMARSPVFYSMLTTDMVEKREKVVTINDWELEVVEELISYLYTATIGPNFSRLAELLALADKYSVAPLVTLISSQLALNITPDTALELGVFGETHNANELLEKCAWYISQDLTCLSDGWADRARNSPKLTTTILEHLREGREKEVAVDRFGTTVRGTYGIVGRRDAIQFRVDAENISSPLFLTGLGLYGTMQEKENIEVGVSVLQDKTTLTHFTTKWECDGTMTPHKILFPHPVSIQPLTTYTIMKEVMGSGFIFQGQIGSAQVELALPTNTHTKAAIVFTNSPLSTNGTYVGRGAVPRLLFKTHV